MLEVGRHVLRAEALALDEPSIDLSAPVDSVGSCSNFAIADPVVDDRRTRGKHSRSAIRHRLQQAGCLGRSRRWILDHPRSVLSSSAELSASCSNGLCVLCRALTVALRPGRRLESGGASIRTFSTARVSPDEPHYGRPIDHAAPSPKKSRNATAPHRLHTRACSVSSSFRSRRRSRRRRRGADEDLVNHLIPVREPLDLFLGALGHWSPRSPSTLSARSGSPHPSLSVNIVAFASARSGFSDDVTSSSNFRIHRPIRYSPGGSRTSARPECTRRCSRGRGPRVAVGPRDE